MEASLKDALNQLEGSGDELVPVVRVIDTWMKLVHLDSIKEP